MADDGQFQLVAFFVKKLCSTECNEESYGKEFSALIHCLLKWKTQMEGNMSPFKAVADHQSF